MKHRLVCLIAATLIAGCSSAGKLRDIPPTAVFVSSQSRSDIVNCINQAWSQKPLPIDAVPYTGGDSIQLRETAGGPVAALVDVTATSDHTTIRYYSETFTEDAWYVDQIKTCINQ
jgi:hypothetical protein